MISYPLQFSVSARSPSGISSVWETSVPGLLAVHGAIPPEFGGPGGGYSPEDFFALAALNCFAATFKVMAEKSQIAFESLDLKGELTVDRDEKGAPWMSHFHLRAQLSGVSNAERANRLLEKTSHSCIVLNSIRTQKSFSFEII